MRRTLILDDNDLTSGIPTTLRSMSTLTQVLLARVLSRLTHRGRRRRRSASVSRRGGGVLVRFTCVLRRKLSLRVNRLSGTIPTDLGSYTALS